MSTEESGDGLESGKCNGLLRDGSGRRCRLPAGHGTEHLGIGYCRRHGGNTATHKANAVKVQAQMDVARLGARRDIHPAEALLELVQFKAAEVEYWRYRTQQLEEQDLTWGVTKEVDGYDPEQGAISTTTREAKPNILLAQLHEAEKTLADFCAASLRAGCDAALVAAAQSRATVWVGVMRAMLADERVSVEGDPDEVLYGALRELQGQ